MQIIEEYISTARDSYSLGNYEEAVPACKLALSKLNGFMSSIQNDEVLLHYLLEVLSFILMKSGY
jgi:hypothetical protein